MKHFIFLTFLLISAFNVAAQNKSLHTSPPGIATPADGNIQVDQNLKNYKTNSTVLELVNGSFEINSGSCIVNGSNRLINANVAATTAYGCAGEIDLMNNDCGYGTAVSGQYFLCLSNAQGVCGDACNLQLTKNLAEYSTIMLRLLH